MPQPQDYEPSVSIASLIPVGGAAIDNELQKIKKTFDDVLFALTMLMRDDYKIGNRRVHKDAFDSTALRLMSGAWRPRGDWFAGLVYKPGDMIRYVTSIYVCVQEHLANPDFNTDLVHGCWMPAGGGGGEWTDLLSWPTNMRPLVIVNALPPLPDASFPLNCVVSLTTDGRIYRNVGNAWQPISAEPEPNTVPPSAPSGLVVTGGFRSIFLEWEPPAEGDAFVEVWRSGIDDRASASKIGESHGSFFADSVPAGASFYYWLFSRNTSGTAGAWNATAGTHGQTALLTGVEIAPLTITDELIAANAQIDGAKIGNLSASKITAGTIGAVSINLGANQVVLDGANSLISVADQQTTPVTRLKLGRLGVGAQNYGIQIFDQAGNLLVGNSGLGPGTVGASQLAVGAIAVGTAAIQDAAITSAKIASLNANKIVATDLSAVSANTGSLTVNNALTINSTGAIRTEWATSYEAGTGLWAGYSSGYYRFRVGDPIGASIKWDGTVLTINGQVSGLTLTNTGYVQGGQTGYNVGTGFWAGNDAGTWRLSIGNPLGNRLTFDGTNLTITGALNAATGTFGAVTANDRLTIGSTGMLVGGSINSWAWPAAGTRGFYLGPSGMLLGNSNGGGRYFIADFAGGSISTNMNLNGADGTFSGTLTASAVNAVNTINIAGNAVTVPAGATGVSPSVTISCIAGQPVIVWAQSNGFASGSGSVTMNVLVNGSSSGISATQYAAVIGTDESGSVYGVSGMIAIGLYVPPSSGNYTFTTSGVPSGQNRTIVVMHSKR